MSNKSKAFWHTVWMFAGSLFAALYLAGSYLGFLLYMLGFNEPLWLFILCCPGVAIIVGGIIGAFVYGIYSGLHDIYEDNLKSLDEKGK